jgi:hypothetical protein
MGNWLQNLMSLVKLYLSPIIDLFNQEIISYELTERQYFIK